MANFENSTWRMAAILITFFSSYLNCKSSNFDEIWYTDTNFDYDKKSVFSKSKMAHGRHIKRRFSALSQHHIILSNAKF